MSISAHIDKLECFACHDSWAPQCYGCHAKRDDRETQRDRISGEETAGRWTETRSYLRWEDPVLGINPAGKVSPYAPGCQALFTYIDARGNTVYHNKEYKTAAGFSGVSMNPFRPHTTRKKEARTCESCHASRKALGLGSGFYDPEANGLPIDFEWERIVDEDGHPIQDTAHRGARPFNLEEMQKISRVGTCLGCHEETDPAFWERAKELYGEARDSGAHRRIIDRLFQGAAIPREGNGLPHYERDVDSPEP
jgi:cytochrome c553